MKITKSVVDAIVLISFFILISLAILWFKPSTQMVNILLLLGVMIPPIYLLKYHPDLRKKTIFFAIPLGLLAAILVGYIAEYNLAWNFKSAFPKIFGFIPIEGFVWYPMWILLVITIYEVFIDIRHKNPKISKNYKWFCILLISSLIIFVLWILSNPPTLKYAYAKIFSIPIILPIIYITIKHRQLIPKLFKILLTLTIFTLIYELLAFKYGLWVFPGEYEELLSFFNLNIPLEEFLLWIILGAVAVVAYYEEFVDDLK